MQDAYRFFNLSHVLPSLNFIDEKEILPVLRALIAGGIDCIELAFAIETCFKVGRIISEQNLQIKFGINITDSHHFEMARDAGAHFVTTYGITAPLILKAKNFSFTFIPGVMTPSEILAARQMGFNIMKFFPAELSGGVKYLKTIHEIFPDVSFYVAGGVTRINMLEYLNLKNVVAVNAAWIAQKGLIKNKNWDVMSTLARDATKSAVLDFPNALENIAALY